MSAEFWTTGSIPVLAEVGGRSARASGFAAYAVRPNEPPIVLQAFGSTKTLSSLPTTHAIWRVDGMTYASWPLFSDSNTQTFLVYYFAGEPSSLSKSLETLAHVVALIRRLLRARSLPESVQRLAEEAATLEARIADRKILDRAADVSASQHGDVDAVKLLEQLSHALEEPSGVETLLYDRILELQESLRDREHISQAKALLREREGLSEEQAHSHLRILSRRTRRRIGQVARDLVASGVEQQPVRPTTC